MEKYNFENSFNKKNYSDINSEVNIKWIDYKQFVRENNLNILNMYKISKKSIVGLFGNTDNLNYVSAKTRSCLLLYGSPTALKKYWILFLPGANLIFLLIVLFGYPLRLLRLRAIERNTYDIESNTKEFKLVRGSQGKIGVINWMHCGDCFLLLKTVYSSIKFVGGFNVIAEKNNQFGLYDLRSKNKYTWVGLCTAFSFKL